MPPVTVSLAVSIMAAGAGGLGVVISVVEYVREPDWLFVGLTLSVLLTLAGSVVAAFWNPGG